MDFTELGLVPAILRAVSDVGYSTPTPIQQQAIPPILEGRDLLGCAQTGTGKTAAFAIPILQLLAGRSGQQARGRRPIRALILTPTRELALQIYESFRDYGKYMPLRSCVIFGGVSQQPQVEALRRGVDVLVATPGRLGDLKNQGEINLENVELFVLDEADRMLDMGFIHDVKRIIAMLPRQKQTLLFSATMPPEISALVNSILVEPVRVTVTPPSTTVEAIEQSIYFVDKANKRKLLIHLLKELSISSALVFTRTKHGADRVARELVHAGIKAAAIHGDKSQGARQGALSGFKNGQLRVLVATDIAARGIDIDELSHVFNFDLPEVPETYVHRIGRTGRRGMSGIAVAFCDVAEKPLLKDIEKLIGKRVPVVEKHPYPMEVFEAPPKQERPPRPPREQRTARPQGSTKPQGAGRQKPAAAQSAKQAGAASRQQERTPQLTHRPSVPAAPAHGAAGAEASRQHSRRQSRAPRRREAPVRECEQPVTRGAYFRKG